MRGSHTNPHDSDDADGIIPAGAGLTSAISGCRMTCRDHPRGCGAHLADSRRLLGLAGSSPRVRGSLFELGKRHVELGIIPAGAGLTEKLIAAAAKLWDHPRGCGAHCRPRPSNTTTMGSSPRVRGSPSLDRRDPGFPGIIPAGAGLTFQGHRGNVQARDHPRGCGAHFWMGVSSKAGVGSSPRVRGSPVAVVKLFVAMGIIPAGAGLTVHRHANRYIDRDHPRGCGAHTPWRHLSSRC